MAKARISREERRRRLVRRHHLHPDHPAASATEAARRLVGLHSSDPTTVFLSARARVPGITVADLERELYDRPTLFRVLGMRGTLFAVPAGQVPLLQHGCSLRLAPAVRKRLVGYLEGQNLARDGEAWVRRVSDATTEAIARRGQAAAMELREDVPELKLTLEFGKGKAWGGKVGVSTRVLFLLACEGRIIRARPRGSWISGQYRWTTPAGLIPRGIRDLDPAQARARILELWLRAYGPGTMADLKWWSGWPLRDVRAALGSLEVSEAETDEGPAFVLAHDLEPTPPSEPRAALLPSLDSTIMGWRDRDWYLGDHAGPLYDRNGNAGPTVWWDGRVVGGWAQTKAGRISYRLLEDVGAEGAADVARIAEHLEDWMGQTRVTPRFRTPLERELAG
ncbi:MAG: winged helix DNA-binding domain-containing protein [bacterium]|nr:winged helix DNA-binding domain-containing protein [bacterium]MDE0375522.1 winged helix DNA-binding domain-containing protein [bacterium]